MDGKERTKSFVRAFVQSLGLFPGLRLMLGTWPSCGVHRGTDLGHQIPPKPCPASLPAACSGAGSPRGQGSALRPSTLCLLFCLRQSFSLSCRFPGSAPHKLACISLEVCCVFSFCKFILFLSLLSSKHTLMFAAFLNLFGTGRGSGSLRFILSG